MTTSYVFAAAYTKSGVATAPSSAPTVTIVDSGNNVLVAAATATALANLTGVYLYTYSGADNLVCFAFFHTTDTSMDQQDLASYTPATIYANSATLGAAGAGLTAIPNSAGVGTLLTRISQTIEFSHVGTHYWIGIDLQSILGTQLTETAGQIAAGVKKFFNVATPTGTLLSLPDAVPGAAGGLPTTDGTKVNQTVTLVSGQTIGANLTQILGSAITGTAADIAASFSTWFNVHLATATLANITTLLGKFTGMTSLTNWLKQAIAGWVDTATTAEINAGGSSYDPGQEESISGIASALGALDVNVNTWDGSPVGPLGTDGNIKISTDTQDLSGSLSVNVGKWLGVIPAALSATGKYIQAILQRWITDDAPGTPAALSSNLVQSTATGGGGLTAQQVRDAMALALTNGTTVNGGSIDQQLAAIKVSYAAVSNVLGTATDIVVKRGNSWAIAITGLGDLTGYTSLWFTCKAKDSDLDPASIFQVKKNASGTGDGLLYLNGQPTNSGGQPATPAQGSIVIDDLVAGNITVVLSYTAAAQIDPAPYTQDVQMLNTAIMTTPTSGTLTVQSDTTRATS